MKLTFIGADHEVTGSCHLLSACGKNILIDYGMEQGKDYFENVPIPVSAPEIDYVFLTHAHVDHSGNLPLSAAVRSKAERGISTFPRPARQHRIELYQMCSRYK